MINKEFTSLEEFKQVIDVDEDKINSILNVEIEKSKAYLTNSLSK